MPDYGRLFIPDAVILPQLNLRQVIGPAHAPPQFVEKLHEITQVLQTLDAMPVSLKLHLPL
jgi:hypothetical protein